MSAHRLYIATGNAGKLRDFAYAAAYESDRWTIAPLPGLEAIPAPPENGTTFHANAAGKALAYAAFAPGHIVLADDSGLEVDALGGAPGVYSARYAAQRGCAPLPDETGDACNNRCLLAELENIPAQAARTARYHCTLVAALDKAVLATADGTLEGELLAQPRGTLGFGYDPLFLLPQLGRTMAEVDSETRLALSHRGHALRLLLPRLTALLR